MWILGREGVLHMNTSKIGLTSVLSSLVHQRVSDEIDEPRSDETLETRNGVVDSQQLSTPEEPAQITENSSLTRKFALRVEHIAALTTRSEAARRDPSHGIKVNRQSKRYKSRAGRNRWEAAKRAAIIAISAQIRQR